jgi:1,4-alpha-glucan branching enzyme
VTSENVEHPSAGASEDAERFLTHAMGSHFRSGRGTSFAVWAPRAQLVTVMGDFNHWNPIDHPLARRGSDGVWEGDVAHCQVGDAYKYVITASNGTRVEKADPFAWCSAPPPRTSSVVWDLAYRWGDQDWMERRARRATLDAPVSIYEVHLGSWRRDPLRPQKALGYRELAAPLIEHVQRLGFTHVELLPVMEHPLDDPWGYHTSGFFAPSRRHGDPQDFMSLIDQLHHAEIGVILDWVPSHFSSVATGLANFDGARFFEDEDPGFGRRDRGVDFNYGRREVASFLASSAEHWLSTYHADGLRVEAVATMIYPDYSRQSTQRLPHDFGGRENVEAIEFLRQLNTGIKDAHPDVLLIGEESTAFPGLTRPAYLSGLGFDLKWDAGWRHQTLDYLARDPVYRRHHFGELTSRSAYASDEHFVLPLSHDEVVNGKGSLLMKMPGDVAERFANLRLLFGYQFALPGKKLVFMGAEFAQLPEWECEESLTWPSEDDEARRGLQLWVSELNRVYRETPALHDLDDDPHGFAWTQPNDADAGVVSFLRLSPGSAPVLALCNFSSSEIDVLAGVPAPGRWISLLNSDDRAFGGSTIDAHPLEAEVVPARGMSHALRVRLPALSALYFSPEGLGFA